MVVINLKLTGALERKLHRFIKHGYATSKAEVLRMGLRELPEYEDISDDPELEQYLLDVKSGKIKPKIVGTGSDLRKLLKK